tara:strand:+ start:320 stop:448 length:129 start_codon:yes stop_codon:yes gene_type:complete
MLGFLVNGVLGMNGSERDLLVEEFLFLKKQGAQHEKNLKQDK